MLNTINIEADKITDDMLGDFILDGLRVTRFDDGSYEIIQNMGDNDKSVPDEATDMVCLSQEQMAQLILFVTQQDEEEQNQSAIEGEVIATNQ